MRDFSGNPADFVGRVFPVYALQYASKIQSGEALFLLLSRVKSLFIASSLGLFPHKKAMFYEKIV